VVDEEVEVQRLQIPRLFVLIASENCVVMLAAGSTPDVPFGGTVLSTVGAGRAAQAVPAAKSSARAMVVNSNSVFLMIFLSFYVFPAKGSSFVALTSKLLSSFARPSVGCF
jgi:hypothetical protein